MEAKKKIRMASAGVPIGYYRSGMLDAWNRRKYRWRCGVPLHKNRQGELEINHISSHDKNGGSYKKLYGAGKGKSCRSEGGLLLPLLFARRSLKDTIKSYRKVI